MKSIKPTFILILFIMSAGCTTVRQKTATDAGLLSSYDLPTYKPGPGSEKYIFKSCPVTPPAVRDFDMQDIYSDPPNYSKVDPQLAAAFNASKKVFQDYVKLVWRAANTYLFTGSEEGAQCALKLLKDWSLNEAILGKLSKDPNDRMARGQALFTRAWIVGELANSYLKIRNAKSLKSSDKEIVVSWFRKLSPAIQKLYVEQPKLITNNLMTWAGATLASVSIITNDHEVFEFSIKKFKETIDQIQNDGTLPQELARKEQALHYHNFAMSALAIIARSAEANNIDLWKYKNNKINLLVALLLPTLKDPESFASISGFKPDKEFIGDDLGWTEFIYTKTHDPILRQYLEKSRPIQEYWFDWDVTAAFGEARL